jgi:DNA-binding HxlR family transcriptional regulator
MTRGAAASMARNTEQKSTHDVEIAADLLGDRWSLLILCKMTLQGIQSFNELLGSVEGIATNILSVRLRKLLARKVIDVGRDVSDRRRRNYRLTPKGKDLAPVLSEMMRWTTRHSTAARRRKMHGTVEERRNGPNKKQINSSKRRGKRQAYRRQAERF